MKIKNLKKIKWLFLISVLMLTGCASVKLDFNATTTINQNQSGRPSSTKVYVYQLTTPYAFENASFADFMNGSNNLDNSIVSRQSFFIIPGESKSISIDKSQSAHYFGVIAGVYDLKNTQWKIVHPLSSHYYRKSYTINFTQQGLSLE